MRRLLLIVLVLSLPCGAASAQKVAVQSIVLDNGMEFLLVPRKEEPHVVMAGWVAKVGSVNERPGITGISHFFEHMMFKGTTTVGTRDPEKDRELLEKINAARGRLRELHLTDQYRRWQKGEIDDPWDQKNDTPEMVEVRRKLKELQDAHREIIVKDEFDQIYTQAGGSFLNAFTSEDLTFYFISVPSNKLELWAWMESDRLVDSVFREFYLERDVVHEERRLRTESTPTGIFDEQFDAMFWESSPYSWPVIGWTSDLNSYTREQAEEYFATYYAPNNLVGVLVGDFEVSTLEPLLRRYFSRLERRPTPPPVVTLEMKQLAEKRMVAEGDLQPQMEIRYHTVPFAHRDGFALDLLAEILNGQTGRLYKSMVEGEKIALSAGAEQDSRKYGGAFSFFGECKGEATPEQLEAGWDREVKRLQTELVPDRELQKVKNRMLADSYRRLQSNFFLLIQIGLFEALGGWEYLNEAPARHQKVTPEDVREVARKYFDRTNRAVALYFRKEGSAPVDPELMALAPEARAQVQQALKRFEQMPVESLERVREALTAQASQAPDEMKAGLEYLLKKLQTLLAEKSASEE